MAAYHQLKMIVGDTLAVDPLKIHDHSTLADLGASDSDKFEIFIGIENVFGIEVDDETRDRTQTYGDLCAIVEKVSA